MPAPSGNTDLKKEEKRIAQSALTNLPPQRFTLAPFEAAMRMALARTDTTDGLFIMMDSLVTYKLNQVKT